MSSNSNYIWTKGIGLLCDVHGADRDVLYNQFDPSRYQKINTGDTVWVKATFLSTFIENVLPIIENPFILVSGDGEDLSIPSAIVNALDLIKSQKILKWYASNFDGTQMDNLISPIPLGIDFHTLLLETDYCAEVRKFWLESKQSVNMQEKVLTDIIKNNASIDQRIFKVYADFHLNFSSATREIIFRSLKKNPNIIWQPDRISRSDLWKIYQKYSFVISPHGNGLDCHRTWEALALGCIIIVKTSSLDSLYDQLPVVIVDDYEEITLKNMEQWVNQHKHKDVTGLLTNKYWYDKIKSLN